MFFNAKVLKASILVPKKTVKNHQNTDYLGKIYKKHQKFNIIINK